MEVHGFGAQSPNVLVQLSVSLFAKSCSVSGEEEERAARNETRLTCYISKRYLTRGSIYVRSTSTVYHRHEMDFREVSDSGCAGAMVRAISCLNGHANCQCPLRHIVNGLENHALNKTLAVE